MKNALTVDGQWWIGGEANEACQGILKFDPEQDLELSVWIPRPFQAAADWPLCLPVAGCPNVIHGADEHLQPVTLLGCSVGSSSATCGAKRRTIHAIAALMGARVESWNEPRFTCCRLQFSLLHNWIDRMLHKPGTTAGAALGFELTIPEDLIFSLPAEVTLRLAPDFLPAVSLTSISCDFSHSFYLHFPQPQSAKVITSGFIPKLQHLLSLLIGDVVLLDDCLFFEDNPYKPSTNLPPRRVRLLQCCEGITSARRDLSGHNMVTRFQDILPELQTILSKWFELDDRLRPVVDLFMTVRTRMAPTIELRFLLLAQALEVFHSRSGAFLGTDVPRPQHRAHIKALVACVPPSEQDWLREKLAYANQKTLATRLTDIFGSMGDVVPRLTVGIEDFSAKVKNTRNYFTHYDSDLLEQNKIARDDELVQVTFALEAIVGVCLLKELGIHGQPIERFLQRYLNMQTISLTTAPKVAVEPPEQDSHASISSSQPPTSNSQPA